MVRLEPQRCETMPMPLAASCATKRWQRPNKKPNTMISSSNYFKHSTNRNDDYHQSTRWISCLRLQFGTMPQR